MFKIHEYYYYSFQIFETFVILIEFLSHIEIKQQHFSLCFIFLKYYLQLFCKTKLRTL
jgi:hypothetical protein